MGGTSVNYIKCKDIDFGREHEAKFYDVQLNVRLESKKQEMAQNGMTGLLENVEQRTTIVESFKEYIKVDTLDGENQWRTEEHGQQDAIKGIRFKKFPKLLHLQLMRFMYDPFTDSNTKINDRFEFTDILDLSDFENDYKEDEDKTNNSNKPIYKLHAV